MGSVSNAEKTYGVPICNDLRRLCVVTIDRDGDWGSNDSARIAPVGEVVKKVYEVLTSEISLRADDLARLLSALTLIIFEHKDELGIKCLTDSLDRRLSAVHGDLLEAAKSVLREFLNGYPDLIAAISARMWSLALKRT